jgi:hypothetical protein
VRSTQTLRSTSKAQKVVERELSVRGWSPDGVTEKITIKDSSVHTEETTEVQSHSLSFVGPIDKFANASDTAV